MASVFPSKYNFFNLGDEQFVLVNCVTASIIYTVHKIPMLYTVFYTVSQLHI